MLKRLKILMFQALLWAQGGGMAGASWSIALYDDFSVRAYQWPALPSANGVVAYTDAPSECKTRDQALNWGASVYAPVYKACGVEASFVIETVSEFLRCAGAGSNQSPL
jgi:hypothetical protein